MWLFSKKNSSAEPVYADDELISRYRASGETRYIGTLFTRYTHLVYGVCLKYLQDKEDARDAVMDIFEDLMQNLHSHDVETFKNWLYTVSKNHCLMILRKEASVEKVKKQWVASFSEEIMDSGDVLHLDRNELDNRLSKMMDALRRLSEEQRTCLELLYLHDKSYQEVSDMTGYSMNQVKSHIQNGKRNMKNLLVKEHG
ncbi:MAG TPA: sigma-70 family RNA polymerase sigma factor [Bacteroidales bacterium]|nr:sigma-70 family RNA polymerase sigma factor [Bacteroidales bacterium]HNS47031.1 sigma-70 family RNA polymerase sigma factor [Bacteroidales bacterium]